MNVLTTIVTVASGIAAVGGAVSVIAIGYRQLRKFDDIRESVGARKEENTLILEALFAALDGLIQRGANGPVTKTREKLREHLIDNRK